MSRFVSLRLLALSLVASLALLVLPHGALAQPPSVEDVYFVDPTDAPCGVSTTTEVSGTITVHIQRLIINQSDGSFWFEGNVKVKLTFTYTSNENGHVLTSTVNFTANDATYEQLGGSVYAFTYSNNGIPLWLRDGNRTLVKDSGRVVFTDTWDLHDLSDPNDNEFLGGEIVSIAGPHPDLTSDAFCNAYVPIMTA